MKTFTSMKAFYTYGFMAIVAGLVMWPTHVKADDITVESISGTWSDIQAGKNLVGSGTNAIFWGGKNATDSQKSGYEFSAPSPVIFPVTLGQQFTVGTFTNFNQEIPIGTAITAATLTVDLSLDINGTLFNNLTFVYNFNHDETLNVAPCLPGASSVCDDKDTFTNNTAKTSVFTVDGKQYTLDLTGFFHNGVLATSYLTPEDSTNSAVLDAVITAVNVGVPEPSTNLLLGSTLLITGWAIRQRKTANISKS